MTSTFSRPVKYLSNADFIKCRLYCIEAINHGSFEKRIEQFDNDIRAHKDTYGYCPAEIYYEKAKYIKEWSFAWRCSKCIRVNVSTGEVDEY